MPPPFVYSLSLYSIDTDPFEQKAIASILGQITNSASPTLTNVQNLIAANPALAAVSPLLVQVQAALAAIVPTVNTIITETLGLVCTM